jgi:transcriptional regulator with XRE-family HTH domain
LARRQIARNDFAEQLGVHPIWLSRRLNGTVEISLGDAERMAEALDLKVEDLLCPAPVVGGAS